MLLLQPTTRLAHSLLLVWKLNLFILKIFRFFFFNKRIIMIHKNAEFEL